MKDREPLDLSIWRIGKKAGKSLQNSSLEFKQKIWERVLTFIQKRSSQQPTLKIIHGSLDQTTEKEGNSDKLHE